jgi:hypothetical protein
MEDEPVNSLSPNSTSDKFAIIRAAERRTCRNRDGYVPACQDFFSWGSSVSLGRMLPL